MSTNLYPGLQYLNTYERDLIRDHVSTALGWSQFNTASVTLHRLNLSSGGSATVNQTTGAVTDPYADVTVTVTVGAVTREDESLMGSQVQDSDRKFLVDRADLSYDLTPKDQIIYDSKTYDVYKTVHCPISNFTVVYARIAGGL